MGEPAESGCRPSMLAGATGHRSLRLLAELQTGAVATGRESVQDLVHGDLIRHGGGQDWIPGRPGPANQLGERWLQFMNPNLGGAEIAVTLVLV